MMLCLNAGNVAKSVVGGSEFVDRLLSMETRKIFTECQINHLATFRQRWICRLAVSYLWQPVHWFSKINFYISISDQYHNLWSWTPWFFNLKPARRFLG